MRLVKIIGLAAVAAIAAMAFVGASSAMATEFTALCKVELQLPCAVANQYPAKTHFQAESLKPELLSSVVNVHCEKSVALGETLQALAKPLEAVLTSLTWVNCLQTNGTACTVSTVALGKDLLILKLSYNLADVQFHGTEVNVHCGFLINCTYGGLPTLHALGTTKTTAASLSAKKLVLERTAGSFCPATAEWDALYTFTLPTPLYISS